MHDTLSKYFSGELSNDVTSRLLNQLNENEALKAEFIRLQNIYALSHLSDLSKNEAEAKQSFLKFAHKLRAKKQRKILNRVFQYAAVALIFIVSTFFLTQYLYLNASGNNQMNTLYVPAGQRAQLTLQDGTSVWLNAQSTLTYPARFSGKNRRVTVLGEAYFDVAKNPKKPFIVSTQNIEMKVLGTQFNVYSYPEAGYIKTDLVEGSLKVYEKQLEENAITLKPDEQIIIERGEMAVSHIPNADYFLWKNGIYTFDNERLLDIIKKLQLYYDVKIIIEDPEIFNVPYTGKFRQRDGIDEILRIIQKIRKFSIDKNVDTNTITLKK